ncbi:serine/threonine-protein kinase [Fimbriiglobus ruber]|uniref:non-specific serine/threonine protein kinase n=1 Tax=Fimbriiglobus ruber TaxID=1908690 RepID=A0A225E119_9BACT|nr:serine/threonine-protein kinase [Fimbriiglobus ruber]OWK46873.1 Serine/threonine protein kinase PrkC, regulator of stationary phase [Fimbriiglobus ruber]
MAEPVEPPSKPPAAPDLTGRTVGEYQVLRKLGQGGMGQVYLARQLSLKREVALKILNRELSENPTALKRFQAEAEAVARVTHANIVQVYAVGEHDGLRFMALEYIDGRNLRDYLERKGPPDLPVALSIMKQVAAALQRASELGIVHRDIKPENILITRKVEVKVADFGLSRYFAAETEGRALNLTQSGMTLGTPLYMSPEQVQGRTVDHRSDIYSFGITCYHLLAGHPPFRGVTAFDVAVRHVQDNAEPLKAIRPDLPAGLCDVVHKMMAKKENDRYQTARDVIRDLARVQKGQPASAAAVPAAISLMSAPVVVATPLMGSTSVGGVTTSQFVPIPPPSPSGQRWLLRIAGAVLVSGVGVIGWWVFGRTHPPVVPKTSIVGLPDVRPPEPMISTRERELKAKIETNAGKPAEQIAAALDLGILYVHERRLDDADKVFKELETKFAQRPALKNPATIGGRLGEAVVLAHRDKPKESNEAFERVLSGMAKSADLFVDGFLIAHPEFGQLVAEALNRNAENLNITKLPPKLEWLRTPGGLTRGPRGG